MRILLPIDDSPPSRAAVAAIIDQFKPDGVEVRVLNVVEWPKGMSDALAFGEGPTAAGDLLASHDAAFHDADAFTNRAARQLIAAGFVTKAEVVAGAAPATILEYAAAWPADIIVVGSHGRRGVDRLVLGSVSAAVVRKARCSVEVVRRPDTNSHDKNNGENATDG
jgi:nucleotide-binding universal stress UspA family protein